MGYFLCISCKVLFVEVVEREGTENVVPLIRSDNQTIVLVSYLSRCFYLHVLTFLLRFRARFLEAISKDNTHRWLLSLYSSLVSFLQLAEVRGGPGERQVDNVR